VVKHILKNIILEDRQERNHFYPTFLYESFFTNIKKLSIYESFQKILINIIITYNFSMFFNLFFVEKFKVSYIFLTFAISNVVVILAEKLSLKVFTPRYFTSPMRIPDESVENGYPWKRYNISPDKKEWKYVHALEVGPRTLFYTLVFTLSVTYVLMPLLIKMLTGADFIQSMNDYFVVNIFYYYAMFWFLNYFFAKTLDSYKLFLPGFLVFSFMLATTIAGFVYFAFYTFIPLVG